MSRLLRSLRKVNQACARNASDYDLSREIYPVATAIQHDAIGRRNHIFRVSKLVVRAEREFHFHVPPIRFGGVRDERLEPSAVRYRLVQPPAAGSHAPRGDCFAHELQSGKGFTDFAIASVDACY